MKLLITLVAAVVLEVYAVAWHSVLLICAVPVAFVVVVALGVTCPRMRFFGPFVCRGNRSKDCVALTFDDGPDPNSTPQLLELLHYRRVPAAFFCVGQRVARNPSLCGQIFREGHLVESHSNTHSKAINLFSMERLELELKQTQDAIKQATGVAPRYFRPPFGYSNPRVFRAAKSAGLTVVGWTVRGFDTVDDNTERVVRRIAKRLRPGAIILLHDANIPPDRLRATVNTLLDTIHASGYEVVRLDRLLS